MGFYVFGMVGHGWRLSSGLRLGIHCKNTSHKSRRRESSSFSRSAQPAHTQLGTNKGVTFVGLYQKHYPPSDHICTVDFTMSQH